MKCIAYAYRSILNSVECEMYAFYTRWIDSYAQPSELCVIGLISFLLEKQQQQSQQQIKLLFALCKEQCTTRLVYIQFGMRDFHFHYSSLICIEYTWVLLFSLFFPVFPHSPYSSSISSAQCIFSHKIWYE